MFDFWSIWVTIWIDVVSCVAGQASWPTDRLGCQKAGTRVKISTENFHSCHALSYTVGAIDFYQFIPLSLTLTLPGGHKVNATQNLLTPFSHMLFPAEMWYFWSSSSWTSWYYFWVRSNKTREITAVLLTVSKGFNVDMHSDVFESIWFRLGIIYIYCWTIVTYIWILV